MYWISLHKYIHLIFFQCIKHVFFGSSEQATFCGGKTVVTVRHSESENATLKLHCFAPKCLPNMWFTDCACKIILRSAQIQVVCLVWGNTLSVVTHYIKHFIQTRPLWVIFYSATYNINIIVNLYNNSWKLRNKV